MRGPFFFVCHRAGFGAYTNPEGLAAVFHNVLLAQRRGWPSLPPVSHHHQHQMGKKTYREKFGDVRMEQLVDMLLGDKLGEGSFRKVYTCYMNTLYVVKVETRTPFSNLAEWELWQAARRLRGGKWAHWLAPCIRLSYGGHILIQARAEKLDKLPEEVPDFLCDVKPANWGLIDGRAVCVDYAWHQGEANILLHGKMCKPGTPRETHDVYTQRWGHPQIGTDGKMVPDALPAGAPIISAPILPSVHHT